MSTNAAVAASQRPKSASTNKARFFPRADLPLAPTRQLAPPRVCPAGTHARLSSCLPHQHRWFDAHRNRDERTVTGPLERSTSESPLAAGLVLGRLLKLAPAPERKRSIRLFLGNRATQSERAHLFARRIASTTRRTARAHGHAGQLPAVWADHARSSRMSPHSAPPRAADQGTNPMEDAEPGR